MRFETVIAISIVSIGGAAGIALCLYLVASVWKGLKSRAWPRVDAVITRSELRQGRHGLRWAEIAFSYEIDDATYESNLPRFGFLAMQSSWGNHATREVARYPVGTQVRVPYNPRKPQEAALHRGVNWPAIAIGAVCCGPWACIGIGLFVNLLRRIF